MKSIALFAVLFCSYFVSNVEAQTAHIPGQLIIQVPSSGSVNLIVNDLKLRDPSLGSVRIEKQISRFLNAYLISFNAEVLPEAMALRAFQEHPGVVVAQYNRIAHNRDSIPNDPQLNAQWQWINNGQDNGLVDADVDAELAWDITKGGLTAFGDTIVVCVVDDGTDLNHPDLIANQWRNYAEIPNDNIDNDNNGYVDDYYGWNINSENDNVNVGSHGVNVDGMIGAVGGNALGVTGLNWNIKIMTVVYGGLSEANVIESYDYPLTLRKRYNETNGAEGAFVVATNSSWGIDNADPNQYPLWCSYYDTLGHYGILSCGATTNGNADIDIVGDMPTACPSDFMVSVGRTSRNDDIGGGIGLINVDLGAPGINIFTTASGGGYTSTTGTSFASPLTAGLIGLLYSAPCSGFMSTALSNPSEGALLIKKYLLDGVDKKASMSGKYLTGGRANAFNSLELMLQNCGSCSPPGAIKPIVTNDTTALLTWKLLDTTLNALIYLRLKGESTWQEITPSKKNEYQFSGLTGCQTYEVRLITDCIDSVSSFSSIISFSTLGCCEAPSQITTNVRLDTNVFIDWKYVYGISEYKVQYKPIGTGPFTTVSISVDSLLLTNLLPCQEYQYRVTTTCPNGTILVTPFDKFTTKGCGACKDKSYCEAVSENPTEEWIGSVTIGDVSNNSAASAYTFFDNKGIIINPLDSLFLSVTPTYSGSSFQDHIRVWLDADQDGDFTNEELIWDPGTTNTEISAKVALPLNTIEGITRLRVILKFVGTSGVEPLPCEGIKYGEIEDYCVEIRTPGECKQVAGLEELGPGTVEVKVTWAFEAGASSYDLRYKKVLGTEWTYIKDIVTVPVALTGLTQVTEYEWQVSSNCGVDTSLYTDPKKFTTVLELSTTEIALSDLKLFPNPSSGQLFMTSSYVGKLNFEIFTVTGVKVFNQELIVNSSLRELEILKSLSPGAYYVTISDGSNKLRQLVIKQ